MSPPSMRSAQPSRTGPARRSGAVTVEMAISLPILFLVLFSAVDFARLNMLRNSAENAAYAGARRAIVPGATADQATAEAARVLAAVQAVNATVSVSPSQLSVDVKEVTVTIRIPLRDNAWLATAANTDRSLIKSCTMTRERTRF